MEKSIKYRQGAVESITQKIKLLDLISILVITLLLLVMARFLYTFLDYIPARSIAALLSITAVLVVLGLFLVRKTSRGAIRAIEEYNNKLNTLLLTTKNIHEIDHSDALFNNIIDVSMEITGADAGAIMLLEGDNLVLKMVKGNEAKKPAGINYPRSKGIAGWVIGSGENARTDDAKNDDRFSPEVDMISGTEIRSVLSVPLKSGRGIIGTLELVNKKDGSFTLEDEGIISYFAAQAAGSIEKTKFFEDKKNYEIHLTNILIDAMEYMPEKRGHSRRVAKYTMLMARALNMTEPEKKRLYHASLLHDIGFLKILHKDISSIAEYQKHPGLGYELLLPINFYADIASIILHHHERYDGDGYPSGLKGKAIPRESMMIYIAEAFDAMVSKCSYKILGKIVDQNPNFFQTGFQRAEAELKSNAGTQFDPDLTAIFLNNIGEDDIEPD